jgi:hypothetical protein
MASLAVNLIEVVLDLDLVTVVASTDARPGAAGAAVYLHLSPPYIALAVGQ